MTPNKEWTEFTTYLADNPKLLDYATNFITLLADLCSGGNVSTGTMVLRKYNLLLALAGLADSQLPVPIRYAPHFLTSNLMRRQNLHGKADIRVD
jgi:hypothetical protein